MACIKMDDLDRNRKFDCTKEEAMASDEGCYCHGCETYFRGLPMLFPYNDEGELMYDDIFHGCPNCLTDEYLVDIDKMKEE